MTFESPIATVLLAEDDRSMREIIKRMLNRLGRYSVLEAPDGEIAYALLTTTPFVNLVISDWDMPKLSGIDFLKKVRAHPELSQTKFVLLTGRGTKNAVVAAIEAKVTNYIVKPFSFGDFEGIIRKLLP